MLSSTRAARQTAKRGKRSALQRRHGVDWLALPHDGQVISIKRWPVSKSTEKYASGIVSDRGGKIIFEVKNDIAKLVVQCTQLFPMVQLYRLSALLKKVADFACVILSDPLLQQGFGALPQVFGGTQQ